MNDKEKDQPVQTGITEPKAQNPNPRANENINDPTKNHKPNPDATDKVGSEITDGEAG